MYLVYVCIPPPRAVIDSMLHIMSRLFGDRAEKPPLGSVDDARGRRMPPLSVVESPARVGRGVAVQVIVAVGSGCRHSEAPASVVGGCDGGYC